MRTVRGKGIERREPPPSGGRLVDEHDGLAVDDAVLFALDGRAEAVAVVAERLDDSGLGGHPVADAGRCAELEVLREVDDAAGEPRQRGADGAG